MGSGYAAHVIDHVTIRVDSLEASTQFYARAVACLEGPEPTQGGGFVEWNDFSIASVSPDRPATRRLHVAFQATSRDMVDAWWEALTRHGHPDDGQPGRSTARRTTARSSSIPTATASRWSTTGRREAMAPCSTTSGSGSPTYERRRGSTWPAPAIAHSTSTDDRLTTVRGEGASLSLLEGEPTRNVHLAFGAPDRETVERFHAAGVAAGFESLGAPASGPSITPATSAHISPIPTAT